MNPTAVTYHGDPRSSLATNTRETRARRLFLCHRFASKDPALKTVPEDRYPEAHDILRRILRGQRVSDEEVQWAYGVWDGVRRGRRIDIEDKIKKIVERHKRECAAEIEPLLCELAAEKLKHREGEG